jgi:hypothetical protein
VTQGRGTRKRRKRWYGICQASDWHGVKVRTSKERRTTSRTSAREPSTPSSSACVNTLPIAVASS